MFISPTLLASSAENRIRNRDAQGWEPGSNSAYTVTSSLITVNKYFTWTLDEREGVPATVTSHNAPGGNVFLILFFTTQPKA